jgi:hypothetical protein
VWLRKSITAATVFGIIAHTPTYRRPVESEHEVVLQSTADGATTPTHAYQTSIPNFGFPRELRDLLLFPGAFLLSGSSAISSWTTSVRLSGTTIGCNSAEDASYRILETVFQLLKLSGCQSDPNLFRKQDQELNEQYHLCLDLDKQIYDAFAQRVSHDSSWLSSITTHTSPSVRP